MSLTTTKVEVVKVWVQLEVGKTIGELQVDGTGNDLKVFLLRCA